MHNLTQDQNGIWSSSGKTRISYPDSGNSFCAEIEDESFWFHHRNNVIMTIMKRLPFNDNFADIGGGNGFQVDYLSKHFPEKTFYLIEPGYEGCINARTRGIENVFNISFQEFPFFDFKIGAVGLFDVLEHIEDDAGFLRQIKKTIGPGKRIYLTTPAYPWMWSANDAHAGHFRRYTLRRFRSLAAKCGLTSVYLSYFFMYLPIPSAMVRAIPYQLGFRSEWDAQRTTRQHKTGHWLRPLISRFNTLELEILQKSRLRFGASCITVYET